MLSKPFSWVPRTFLAIFSLCATSWPPGTILSSTSPIWPEEKPSPESLEVWRLSLTEMSHPPTLLCWLPSISWTDLNSWRSLPCTSDSEVEEEPATRPQDLVPNPPWEPLPVMVSRSAELRMSPPFLPTPPEEKEVERVEGCDCLYFYI